MKLVYTTRNTHTHTRLVINFEMHHYASHEQILCMKDPRCASLFLSYTVRNQIKRYVDDKMIDSSLNSDRMLVTKQQMLPVMR